MEPTEHFGIYFWYNRRLFQRWVSSFKPNETVSITLKNTRQHQLCQRYFVSPSGEGSQKRAPLYAYAIVAADVAIPLLCWHSDRIAFPLTDRVTTQMTPKATTSDPGAAHSSAPITKTATDNRQPHHTLASGAGCASNTQTSNSLVFRPPRSFEAHYYATYTKWWWEKVDMPLG